AIMSAHCFPYSSLFVPCVKHDISLPISAIPEFVAQNSQALAAAFPQARLMIFGHLGDGNLHYNVLLSDDVSATWASLETDIQDCVHDHVVRLRSEEHTSELQS